MAATNRVELMFVLRQQVWRQVVHCKLPPLHTKPQVAWFHTATTSCRLSTPFVRHIPENTNYPECTTAPQLGAYSHQGVAACSSARRLLHRSTDRWRDNRHKKTKFLQFHRISGVFQTWTGFFRIIFASSKEPEYIWKSIKSDIWK